jgi:hypothetical protein
MGMRGGAVLCIPHSAFCLEGALQVQGFGGEGAGGRAEKLKLGKQSTPRSLVHPPQYRYGGRESGNRKAEGAAVSGCLMPSPSSCSSRPSFLMPLVSVLRFPLSDFSFQLSVFQLFASWPVEQRALGLLLAGGGFDRPPNEMGSASFHL